MTLSEIKFQIECIWDRIDLDGSGYIDYTEWGVGTLDKIKTLSEEKLRSAFALFDLDGSGTISAQELKTVLGKLGGQKVQDLVWINMIKEVDRNGDGEINFEEFKGMMKYFIEQEKKQKEEEWQ